MKWSLLIILFFGLIIRIFLIPNPGFEADVAFWKSWSLAAADHGIVWMTENTNNNYPPGFGYVLWGMGKVYALIGNPHNFNDYWDRNNYAFLFVSKLIPILSDIILTLIIYWALTKPERLGITMPKKDTAKAKRPKTLPASIRHFFTSVENIPLFGATLYYLHPVIILDGAWWGQVDAFGVLFLIVTCLLLIRGKPGLAMFVIIFGFLLKLQNVIYLPILFVYIVRKFGLRGLTFALLGSILAWIIGTFPFIVSGKTDMTLYLLTTNSDWFPWLSLHAYNIWWIISGGNGMGFSDKFLLAGQLSPKIIGLILFSATYLVSILMVMIKPTPKILFTSLYLAVFSFFMMLTQSHERYLFPIFVIFPICLHYLLPQTRKNLTSILLCYTAYYTLLSLTTILDIHRTLLVNYPHNGLPVLTYFQDVSYTIFASYLNVILYCITFVFAGMMVNSWLPLIGIFAAIIGLGLANKDYMIKGKVSLTKLKPIYYSQEFGIPQTNLTVMSYQGPKSWTRLSDQYYFFPLGIGSHAKSEITYEIRGKFSKFSSNYGIDTEANSAASVQFQVVGDNKVLFTSKVMGRYDPPQHVEVNIKNVRTLKLIILPTEDGNRDDHADWLNPVLYK